MSLLQLEIKTIYYKGAVKKEQPSNIAGTKSLMGIKEALA